MRLFDTEEYELPSFEKVDWHKTKIRTGIFLATYKISRERVCIRSIPSNSTTLSFIYDEKAFVLKNDLNIDTERINEFVRLSDLFLLGYSAIMHPFKPDVTERRRKIFLFRYFYGLPIEIITERINYQKNIIVDESKVALIQFSNALDLLVV